MFALTGATGYIGRALGPALLDAGLQSKGQSLVTLGRRALAGVAHRPLDLQSAAGYRDALAGVRCIIHCAGIAHHNGEAPDYERVNLRSTVSLADAALSVGCRHFVFVRSLNIVPPDCNDAGLPARRLSRPTDDYARSKWQAEQQLEALFAGSDTALTIIRPALVYDRELVANLAQLARVLSRLPLQLPAVGRRSMVSRPDLVAAIVDAAIAEPPRGVRRLAISDGQCYDLQRIGRAFNDGGAIRLPVPALSLRWLAALRDRWAGLPGGTTWAGLAGEKWCPLAADTPRAPQRMTLEACFAGAREGK